MAQRSQRSTLRHKLEQEVLHMQLMATFCILLANFAICSSNESAFRAYILSSVFLGKGWNNYFSIFSIFGSPNAEALNIFNSSSTVVFRSPRVSSSFLLHDAISRTAFLLSHFLVFQLVGDGTRIASLLLLQPHDCLIQPLIGRIMYHFSDSLGTYLPRSAARNGL